MTWKYYAAVSNTMPMYSNLKHKSKLSMLQCNAQSQKEKHTLIANLNLITLEQFYNKNQMPIKLTTVISSISSIIKFNTINGD